MKTHANNHHGQLAVITFLVSTSLLLLAFGIYKTISFQHNSLSEIENQNLTLKSSTPVLDAKYGELLYTHTYTNDATDAPLKIEEWMTDHSSWQLSTNTNVNTQHQNSYSEPSLQLEKWMTNLNTWLIGTHKIESLY